MNLAQILETLPPRVYLRSGELVIHFSTPADLAARVAETHAAFSAIDRPEGVRSDTRGTRGRAVAARPTPASGESLLAAEPEGKED